jgi:hypothetical protein
MTLVTGYQHDTFISRIDSLIKKIEDKDITQNDATVSITELQDELSMLNQLFTESHKISEKLRFLADEYKKRQRIARVKLRLFRVKYGK